jgi:hypothetical protein
MHNFMLEDLAGSLRAICLFPLFLVVPGYAIAWWGDLFQFRRRTAAFRLAASVPLSIAVCPILTYLAGRVSPAAVWILYGLLAAAFAAALPRARRTGGRAGWGIPRSLWPYAAVLAAWMIVEVFSLVDLQIGHRLYYPVSSIDTSVRASFVQAISTSGIPPENPFFLPGRPVPLRYHYFWLMMCSLVERTGGAAVTPRQAIIGGTFWCGVGLMALIALYLRLFCPAGREHFRRRFTIALMLAAVTGLDIIPSALLVALHFMGKLRLMLPSVEWWNEHVDWFLYTAFWAPHALASMVACFMGFLLLWKAPEAPGRWGPWRYALAAGAALASAVGASIYVAFVFAVFLLVWTAMSVARKWRRETRGLLAAGGVAMVLVLPYVLDLRGAGGPIGGGFPLQFTVRQFTLATVIGWHTTFSEPVRLLLINGPLVPLNYLLELGVFFAAGLLWWRARRGRKLSRQELACAAMISTSVLICTFLRSSVIGCNDLGWRGFLIAQFILLLLAADVISERKVLPRTDRAILAVFFALGAAGTVYDLAITRTYPILADAGVLPPLDWMSPDRHSGERTYASRAAYEWVRAATPENAAIQFNPNVVFQETPEMLYASRRTVAADTACNATFGGDPRDCAPIVARLNALYAPAAPGALQQACAALPMNMVVAKDTDGVWKDRRSWVWSESPVFANGYLRLFSCPPAADPAKAGLRASRRGPPPS